MPAKPGLQLFQTSIEATIGAAAGGFTVNFGNAWGTWGATQLFQNLITAPVPLVTDPVMNQVNKANGLGNH